MLGGNHFKKKIDKKLRKKEAKKAAASAEHGGGKQKNAQDSHKKGGGSNLKGPIVNYGGASSWRDSGNDKKNVPFASRDEEKMYNRARRMPRNTSVYDAEKGNAARVGGASSAAQRRRVLRQRNDDDLLSHFKEKLNASTFRLLNEQLYNAPTAYAGQLLRDRGTFVEYHTGYKQQLVQWPMNPNKLIVESLLGDRRGRFVANKTKSMPGHIPPSWVIADMGCGEAQIAEALQPKGYTVHSFDFCALNERVTVANTASVPLEDDSVDVCVFSLSLMATDYVESLYEAFRILKPKRLLKIIEVRSRVPAPKRLADLVEGIGFELDYQDVAGDYFVAFDFIKKENQPAPNRDLHHDPNDVLVPSLYKKR